MSDDDDAAASPSAVSWIPAVFGNDDPATTCRACKFPDTIRAGSRDKYCLKCRKAVSDHCHYLVNNRRPKKTRAQGLRWRRRVCKRRREVQFLHRYHRGGYVTSDVSGDDASDDGLASSRIWNVSSEEPVPPCVDAFAMSLGLVRSPERPTGLGAGKILRESSSESESGSDVETETFEALVARGRGILEAAARSAASADAALARLLEN